jgi:hypothetical protein
MSSARTNADADARFPDAQMNLENQLKLSLRRVQPNPEFVGHLQTRLTSPPMMTIERRQNAAFGLLVLGFSLASGVFVVWLLRQLRAA